MHKSHVEYAALRYKSAKLINTMAMDVKAARVVVEEVLVDGAGRVRKFRCPPGTRRAGKWTNSMGTTCNLGAARAGLAKLGAAIERVAVGDGGKKPKGKRKKEKRTILGGIGKKLTAAADELATLQEIEEALKDSKKGKKRSLLGRKLTDAADVLATEDEIEAALREALAKKKGKDIVPGDGDKTPDLPSKPKKDGPFALFTKKKKLLETVPDGTSDKDRDAYSKYLDDAYRDHLKAKKKGFPDFMDYEDWDADRIEKAEIAKAEKKKPKTPKGKTPGKLIDKPEGTVVDKPETPKPVADEDLPDFEMPSLVPPVGKEKGKLAQTLDLQKERLADKPEGVDPKLWKEYEKYVNSQNYLAPLGGNPNDGIVPEIQNYADWHKENHADKPLPLTQGNLPVPETTVTPDKPKKPKKPTGPAKAAEAEIDVAAKKNEKNQGKKPKKLAGKQYGGLFKNEEAAKNWGYNTATDRQKEIYVVKTENGKFRLVDKERFLAGDEEAVFAFAPNGSIIDLPDAKAEPDEIVLDVENAVEKIEEEVAEEIKDLAKDDGKLELTKSKTGLFLPDDLSSEMVAAYGGEKANVAFLEEFGQQREEVLQFWDSRLGDKKFDTSEDMLAAIDKLIADESKKVPKNEKVLGVLRTERKNFAAMWVADKGDDGLDPYQRFNYIQPKRRKAIIEAANIEGLVIGKKDINEKEKIDLDPNVDLIPDDGNAPDLKPDGTPDVTPDAAPATEPPTIKPNGTSATPPAQPLPYTDAAYTVDSEMGWNEGYSKKIADEKFKNEGEEKLAELRKKVRDDKFLSDVEKEKMDADEDYWPPLTTSVSDFERIETSSKIEAKKKEAIEHAHNGDADKFEATLDEVFELQHEKAFQDRIHEEAVKRQNASLEKALKEDLTDPADIADTPEAVDAWAEFYKKTDTPKPKVTVKDWLDDKEWANAQSEKAKNDFWISETPPEGDISWMETEQQINNHFDGLIATMDEQYGWNVGHLEEKEANGVEIKESDVAYLPQIEGMKQYYEIKREEALDALKKKDVDVAETDKINLADNKNANAVQSLFGTEIPGYDHAKLVDTEDAKLGDSLESIIKRQNAKGKYTTDLAQIVEKLPDNFADLSPEQQRLEILQAAGTSDELQAAKIIARSAVVNRYGKTTTLTKLNDILDNFNNPDLEIGSGLTPEISAARVEAAEDRLVEVISNTQKLSDPNLDPVTRLVLEGELNDARAELVSNLLIHHKVLLKEGDIEEISKNAQALVFNKDSLPTKVNNGILTAFNKGIDIKKADAFPKVPKGMPKPTGFDSTYLGSMQPDGSAIAYKIPLGYNGIFTLDDASARIADGAQLSEIPDELLFDTIKLNTGEGKRFSPLFDKASGYNETVGFVDGLTGKKFIVKLADRNDQEHTQEAAGSVLAQILGQPVTGMRFGSGITKKPLPGHKAELEGKTMGDQRALVIEHVGNMFDPEKFEILSSPPSVSSGDIDPESLARLMVLDRSMNYFDRTAANVIPVRNKETGKVHLHPIDHGNGFYPFKGGDEVEVGFRKITKTDNIPLHRYLDNMSEEDRLIFAKALGNATSRYKKANYEAEFSKLADVQGLTQAERDRLMKHAKFLEDRKESLDWDKMSTDLLKSFGYPEDQIPQMLSGKDTQGFKLAENTLTIKSAADVVGTLPPPALMHTTLYDGDSIVGFRVGLKEVSLKGKIGDVEITGAKGKKYTMMNFKIRGEAADAVDADATWQVFKQGQHTVPHLTPAGNNLLNFSSPKGAPGDGGATTYYKVLDDGTILLRTKHSGYNGPAGWDNYVRIFVPGGADDALVDDAKTATRMEAAGIKNHGLPSQEDLRDVGVRRLAVMLNGEKSVNKSVDDLEDELEKLGFTSADLVVEYTISGEPVHRLSREATERVQKEMGITRISHKTDHNVYNDEERKKRIVGMLTGGQIGSTESRFNSGVAVKGWSSDDDATKNSSNYIFTRPQYSGSVESSGDDAWHWYASPDQFLSRIDGQVTPMDTYGNPDTRVGLLSQKGNTSAEIMFQSTTDITNGIFIVPPQYRDEILEAVKSAGVTEHNGIPIEMLISTPSESSKAYKELRDTLAERGIIWIGVD